MCLAEAECSPFFIAVICVVSDDLKVMVSYPTAGFMDNPRQTGVLNILAGLYWQESTDTF